MSKYPRPLVSIDVVLFSLIEGKLNFFLLKRERGSFIGEMALPGGRVYTDSDMDIEDTVIRILENKVNLKVSEADDSSSKQSVYFEQLHTFSGMKRDPEGWSVSVAYFAVIRNPKDIRPLGEFEWIPVDELDGKILPFDHKEIVESAVNRVRTKSAYSSLACYFLPNQFTWKQMQSVYEQVMNVELQPRTFRRRIEEMNVVQLIENTVFINPDKTNCRPSAYLELHPNMKLSYNSKLQRIKL